jgi:NAD(P)H-dependent FMN reductase
MPRLLIVHHTPPKSSSVQSMLAAVQSGATDDAIEGVDVVVRPALEATPEDALAADAFLLGTPANLGYMSGALKHFFDEIYVPCLETTIGRPYGVYVHGRTDTTGAELAITKIVTGLQWQLAAKPVLVIGPPTPTDLDACWDLGATLAAGLTL